MKSKFWKRLLWVLLIVFILCNVVVYNHAYRFTHFSSTETSKPKKPEELSLQEKLVALFKGVNVPKPKNHLEPQLPYETFYVQSHKKLEGWNTPRENSKGVVVFFHGYISCKANTMPYAHAFQQKGYSTVQIDFMGHGGSEGLETTIGYKEGLDVKAAFEYARQEYPNQKVILHGSSMGAVAIMKSIEQYNIKPDKIILECPFGTMLETAKGRFEVMGLPATPLAHWLILFGGWQTGFDAFEHNPTDYARKIAMPTLLLSGAKDARVSKAEIDDIYRNLAGEKNVIFMDSSAHQIYLTNDAVEWNKAVDLFLND